MTILQITLRTMMEKESINASQLAKLTGIKQPVIHRILSGETQDPKVGTISAIAKYFGVSIDKLLNTEEKSISQKAPLLSLENLHSFLEGSFNATEFLDVVEPFTGKNIAIHVSDTTMRPRFFENSIILLDTSTKPKDRDFVVAFLENKNISIFRQILFDGPDVYLKALNTDFPMIKLENNFKIIGVVVHSQISL